MFSEYYLNIAMIFCVIAVLSSLLCAQEMFGATIALCAGYIWFVFHWTSYQGLSLILGGLFLLFLAFGYVLSAKNGPDEEECPDCNGTGMIRDTDYHANIPGCYVDVPCTRCGGEIIRSKHIAAGYYSAVKHIPGSGRIKKDT